MIKIKPMLPDQWQLHQAVRCAALADAPLAFSNTLEKALKLSDEDWAALTRQRANDAQGITFFACEGETACGMAGCRVDGDEAEMFAVWVAPAFRHSGTGTALVEFARNWAELKGAKLLKVGVYHDNTGALAFYRAAGFDDVGRAKPELATSGRTGLELVMSLPSPGYAATRH